MEKDNNEKLIILHNLNTFLFILCVFMLLILCVLYFVNVTNILFCKKLIFPMILVLLLSIISIIFAHRIKRYIDIN